MSKPVNSYWIDNFEETASDILKLQDAISGKVAQVLLIKLKLV